MASFDFTVYQLSVPTDKPELLDRALRLLRDWAHDLSFDPAVVERERAATVLNFDAQSSAANADQLLAPFPGSRYAERPPFGKKESVERFQLDRLKQFYTDWYRPDLMAVIAVGDFDQPAIENLIKEHFSSIPGRASPRPRQEYPVPDVPGTLIDFGITRMPPPLVAVVQVFEKAPRRETSTVAAYRGDVVDALAARMLLARLTEISRKPDAPFAYVSAEPTQLVAAKVEMAIHAMLKEERVEGALDSLLTEIARAARFGFTPNELDRQKRSALAALDQPFPDSKLPAPMRQRVAAHQYVQHFLWRKPAPGPAAAGQLSRRFLPDIGLDDVNSVAKHWAGDSRRVSVRVTQKEGLERLDKSRLAAVAKTVGGKALNPYVDSVDADSLMSPTLVQDAAAVRQLQDRVSAADNAHPNENSEVTLAETASWLQQFSTRSGTITRRTTNEAFGVTEWELSNGVTVVLKPTAFKDDEIVVRAFSPGGTSLARDQDILAARAATEIVSAGGLGRLDAADLAKFLAGRAVSVSRFISETDEGLTGSASRKELETMFQLIQLAFTQPRADSAALGAVLSGRWSDDIDVRVYERVMQDTLAQDHVRARWLTTEMIRQVDVEKALAFYKDRFADASDFTFVFVGSLDVATLQPLVERYLGGLPTLYRQERAKDVGIRPPKGIVEKTVTTKSGFLPSGVFTLAFTGPFRDEPLRRVEIRSLAMLLQNRLRGMFRGSTGPAETVAVVEVTYPKAPQETYGLTILVYAPPEPMDDVAKTVFREIGQLKSEGPREAEVTEVKAALVRDYQTNSQSNTFLRDQIAFRYQRGEDLASLFGMDALFDTLTPAIIQAAARTYFDVDNYVKVTLMPEKQRP